jgi:exosome complex component RRP42
MDALFIAARAALCTARIPATETQDVGDGRIEFELIDDVARSLPLAGSASVPLCVTIHQVGQGHVVDASPVEETCSTANIHVSFSPQGHLCALQKGGDGAIEPALLMSMMQTGREQARRLLHWMDGELAAIEKVRKARESAGEAPLMHPLFK